MRLTRRVALGVAAGLAGCQTNESATEPTDEPTEATDQPTGEADEPSEETDEPAASEYFEDGRLIVPVANDSVETERVAARTAAGNLRAGPELIAYDDDGTARVVDGATQEVPYQGEDIGQLITRMQAEYPGGVHLHLSDLFSYETTAEISTAMRLTGERAASDFQRSKARHKGVAPTGLRYTGDGVAVRLYNGTEPTKYAHLSTLSVQVPNGTIGL